MLIALIRLLHKFLNSAESDLFVDLEDTHANHFTRQGIFNEKNAAVYLGHTRSLMTQIYNFYFNNIVLF